MLPRMQGSKDNSKIEMIFLYKNRKTSCVALGRKTSQFSSENLSRKTEFFFRRKLAVEFLGFF